MKIKLSPEQREKLVKDAETFLLGETGFKFLDDHYGLRPGQLHILCGTQGKGKSTLVRSMMFSLLKQKKRVMFYSTEESQSDFELTVARAQVPDEDLETLDFVEDENLLAGVDVEDTVGMFQGWMSEMRVRLAKERTEVLIFDNITTTELYDNRNGIDQTRFVKVLKKIAHARNVAIVVVAHLGKNIIDSMMKEITGNDVRGNNAISNESQQLYVFRRVDSTLSNGKRFIHAFIQTLKGRQESVAGNYYLLTYNHSTRTYVSDCPVEFEKIKTLMQNQNRFTKK